MLTIFIIIFVLVGYTFLTSSYLRAYKYPVLGFLSVCLTIIIVSIWGQNITTFEKIGLLSLTTLEIIAVPFLLYFLIAEKSVPKIVALIIGGGLIILAQELADYGLKDGNLLVQVKDEAIGKNHSIYKNFELNESYRFDPVDGTMTDLDDYICLSFKQYSPRKLKQVISVLQSSEKVIWVEVDDDLQLDMPELKLVAPNRTSKNKAFYNDPLVSKQWGFDAIGLMDAFEWLSEIEYQPKKKAKVFVLDTGINGEHEDLKDNYKVLYPKDQHDGNGHGTHCAGTISAINNNGKGIASFNYNNACIDLSAIAVLNQNGMGKESAIIKGIIEAVDSGADVISMSLGGLANPFKQKAYNEALEYAAKHNVLVVAAAGNSNANAKYYLPTSNDYVFSVASINQNLQKSSFSNYIQDVSKGIAAPGEQIMSTDEQGSYKLANGTSMAAPFVTGLLALMRTMDPSITAEEAHAILKEYGVKTKQTKQTGSLIQVKPVLEYLYHQQHDQ